MFNQAETHMADDFIGIEASNIRRPPGTSRDG